MQKIKTFFTTLFRSFTDPSYYQDVIAAKGTFSFKYFSLFYVFLSLIVTSAMAFTFLKTAPNTVNEGLDELVKLYPESLEVTFDTQSAQISTQGVEEPVIITMPKSENITTDLENILVIDTAASAESITDYKTAMLLTQNNLVTINESDSGFQIIPLKELAESLKDPQTGHAITSITLNKNFIESNLPLVKKTIATLIKYAPFAIFPILAIGYIISRLFFLLLMTLITSIVALILGKNLSYGKMFQLGLHTVTVTDGITKLQELVFHYPVPWLYSFAFLGITFIALLAIKPARQ